MCIVQLKDQKHINTNVLIDTQYIYITYSIMCTGVFLNLKMKNRYNLYPFHILNYSLSLYLKFLQI